MNNNLLSPGVGPPIKKKQRGGRTPGSIKAQFRSIPRGPPPTTSASTTSASSNAATSTSNAAISSVRSSEVVDDAIARRRAELRRLREKARGALGNSNSSNSKTNHRSNTNIRSNRSSAPPPTSSAPPPTPKMQSIVSKRTSDIFPTAPKSPSMIPKPIFDKKKEAEAAAILANPPVAAATTTTTTTITTATATTNANGNPNLPPTTPGAIPPTPAVGRRLEFPSGAKSKSKPNPPTPSKQVPPRSKSVPPRLPPGPPPKKAAAAAGTASPSGASPSGASSSSPSTTNTTTKGKPGFTPMAKVKAKKRPKANTTTSNRRPVPVRPGTFSLLPTVKTRSPKNENDDDEQEEEAAANSAAAAAPPSQIPPPAVGSSLLTETPKTQKQTSALGSGADTPPSSGSSARRQKLQFMREQALVASSLQNNTTTTNASSKGPPPTTTNAAAAAAASTKTSFYTASEAGPATAAFAKATMASTSTKATPSATASAPPEIPNLANLPPRSKQASATPASFAQARLEDAYQKSEREKIAALVKIKELEDRLSQSSKDLRLASKQNHQQQTLDVQTLLSVAETDGPRAALEWAANNNHHNATAIAKPASRTGFDTGMGATPRKRGMPATIGGGARQQTPAHRRARMAFRALKAKPSTEQQTGNNNDARNEESPEATERRLLRKFKEAARYVSHEFSSELATYVVRKPYGIPTVSNPPGLLEHCRPPTETEDAYQRRAHVSDKTTIEVAVLIKADKTPSLVFGAAGIRYQTNPSSRNVPPNWKHFEDVDAEDRPLGHVTYIDGQANEKEYSLDEVLEEALLVREQYCGTLTSTALALPDPQQQQQPQQIQLQQHQQQQPLAESNKPKPKEDAKQDQQQQQQQQPLPAPSADIDSGSSDVLVVFLGMVVSFLLNLVYGIFIGTPLKIVRTTVVLVAASVLVQALQLYLADGYNEWALREFTTSEASTCSSLLASDLSWFSNQHPGIM